MNQDPHTPGVSFSAMVRCRRFFDSEERVQVAIFVLLIFLLVLCAIIAVGNWNLYSRVEQIETTLGLPLSLIHI